MRSAWAVLLAAAAVVVVALAAPAHEFSLGDKVKITGLAKDRVFNGRFAEITGSKGDRWVVKVEGEDEPFALRPANLESLRPGVVSTANSAVAKHAAPQAQPQPQPARHQPDSGTGARGTPDISKFLPQRPGLGAPVLKPFKASKGTKA